MAGVGVKGGYKSFFSGVYDFSTQNSGNEVTFWPWHISRWSFEVSSSYFFLTIMEKLSELYKMFHAGRRSVPAYIEDVLDYDCDDVRKY